MTIDEYIIEDHIQNYFKYEHWSLLRDVLLIGFVYIFYSNTEFDVFLIALKYYVLLLIIRYLISITTVYKNKKSNEKYFQISAHLGLFMIIILLCIQTNTFNLNTNENFAWLLIIIYGLLNISTRKHYSSDILSTMLLVYYLFTNNYLKSIL